MTELKNPLPTKPGSKPKPRSKKLFPPRCKWNQQAPSSSNTPTASANVSRVNSKPQSVVAKFLNFKDSQVVLKSAKNLRGHNIWVREDYSDRVNEIRRQLVPQMKAEREAGKRAFIRFNKLVVHDDHNSRVGAEPS